MKNLFKNRLVLIGLLLLTVAAVKASEPVKPDTATKSTGARIIPAGGGYWNYTDVALFAAVQVAIPDFDPDTVIHDIVGGSIHWLKFTGKYTSTGKPANVYLHLELNGDWYELDIDGIPNQGGGAWSCSGGCMPDDEYGNVDNETVCKNVSVMVMVLCGCSGGAGSPSSDCVFQQYPIQVSQTMYNYLKQIHD